MGWWDTMELLLVGAPHLGRLKNNVNWKFIWKYFHKWFREIGRDSTEAGCSYTDKRGMSGEV